MRSLALLMDNVFTFLVYFPVLKPITCFSPWIDTFLTLPGFCPPRSDFWTVFCSRDPPSSLCLMPSVLVWTSLSLGLRERIFRHWIVLEEKGRRKRTGWDISIKNKPWRNKKQTTQCAYAFRCQECGVGSRTQMRYRDKCEIIKVLAKIWNFWKLLFP